MTLPEIEESDVIRAVTETLKYRFPKIKVSNNDVKIADRPCFYLDTVSTRHKRIARKLEETTITFTLFYFAPHPHKDNNHLNDMKKAVRDFLRCKIETLSKDKKNILCFDAEDIEQEINTTLSVLSNDFSITFETSTPVEIIDNQVSRFEDAKDNVNTKTMNEIKIKDKE